MSNAWEITTDDVRLVLTQHGVTLDDEQISELHDGLDHESIEDGVLDYTNFDAQVEYSLYRIEQHLIEEGVISGDPQHEEPEDDEEDFDITDETLPEEFDVVRLRFVPSRARPLSSSSRDQMAATHQNAGIAANSYIKAKAEIKSYAQADAFLDGEQEKVLGSNVRVRKLDDERIAIRLYETNIVIYYPDGTFSVDNGGHNTPTTSTRLNQFTPHGWFFYHHKKKLGGNYRWSKKIGGHPLDHNVKLPGPRLYIEDDGVYFGEELLGEYIDDEFYPNLDLMNHTPEFQTVVEFFLQKTRPYVREDDQR